MLIAKIKDSFGFCRITTLMVPEAGELNKHLFANCKEGRSLEDPYRHTNSIWDSYRVSGGLWMFRGRRIGFVRSRPPIEGIQEGVIRLTKDYERTVKIIVEGIYN